MAFSVSVSFLGWVVDYERVCKGSRQSKMFTSRPRIRACPVCMSNAADKVAKMARDSWNGLGVGDNMDERKDCNG